MSSANFPGCRNKSICSVRREIWQRTLKRSQQHGNNNIQIISKSLDNMQKIYWAKCGKLMYAIVITSTSIKNKKWQKTYPMYFVKRQVWRETPHLGKIPGHF